MKSVIFKSTFKLVNRIKKHLRKEKGLLDSEQQGFGGYELKIHPGKNKQLIIAFSGVGNINSNEVNFEWGNSLLKSCEDSHVIFIKDNLRQWYTNPLGHTAVVDYLQAYMQEHKIEHSLAFGLSMGGYGALVFSALTRFDYVIALASRSCVGMEADFDSRNKTLMRAINDGPYTRITEHLNPNSHYCFITSVDQVNDLIHFSFLRQSCPSASFYITRGDHNLGHEMNLRGAMGPFLQWLTTGCTTPPPKGIIPADKTTWALANYLAETKMTTINFNDWLKYFSLIEKAKVPLYLLNNVVQHEIQQQRIVSHYPCPTYGFINAAWIHPYLGWGWYKPENNGVWSQGLWHELNGQVVDTAHSVNYQIRLNFDLYLPNSDSQPVLLEVHQEKNSIKKFIFDRKQKSRSIVLPLALTEQNFFNLRLYTPHAAIPAQKDQSNDCREIAIYLKGFVITYAA